MECDRSNLTVTDQSGVGTDGGAVLSLQMAGSGICSLSLDGTQGSHIELMEEMDWLNSDPQENSR